MRNYYILAVDSRLTKVHALIPNYSLADPTKFSSAELIKCEKLSDTTLMCAPMVERTGRRVDYVGCPFSWPIASPRLQKIFLEMAPNEIQLLPFQATDAKGNPVLSDYRVVNVLRRLDGSIDLDKSTTSRHAHGEKTTLHIMFTVFRLSAIPESTHVFRPQESPLKLVVSESFAKELKSQKIEGQYLIKTGVS